MRDVNYTTLSGQDLFNMTEDSHSAYWQKEAAADKGSKAVLERKESRSEEFAQAAAAHLEAANEHSINWENATTGKKSTGNFTATPRQNSTASMWRNN